MYRFKFFLKLVILIYLYLFSFLVKDNHLHSVLNIELGGIYATRPSNIIDAVDQIYGAGFGVGLDIVRIQSWMMVQFRFDAMVYLFLYPDLPIRTNFPFFFGTRLLLGGGFMPSWFVPYLEIGYEMRIKRDFVAGAAEILTHGAAVGFGVEFFPVRFFYLGINGRFHFLDMEFFSVGPTLGFRL